MIWRCTSDGSVRIFVYVALKTLAMMAYLPFFPVGRISSPRALASFAAVVSVTDRCPLTKFDSTPSETPGVTRWERFSPALGLESARGRDNASGASRRAFCAGPGPF